MSATPTAVLGSIHDRILGSIHDRILGSIHDRIYAMTQAGLQLQGI